MRICAWAKRDPRSWGQDVYTIIILTCIQKVIVLEEAQSGSTLYGQELLQ